MEAWGWERGNEAGVRTAVLHERLCEIFIFLSNPFYLSFFSQFENRVSLVNIFSLNILYATIKVVSVGTEHEVESMRTRIRQWEHGDVIIRMGAWGRDHTDGSMGMGAWGWEHGDGMDFFLLF